MCRHQMRGPEPRRQQTCAVHRCARRDRSLAAATVAFLSVRPAPQRGRAGVAASGTDESIRPATFEQEGRAARLVRKRRLKFGERSHPRHGGPPLESHRGPQQGLDTTFRPIWDKRNKPRAVRAETNQSRTCWDRPRGGGSQARQSPTLLMNGDGRRGDAAALSNRVLLDSTKPTGQGKQFSGTSHISVDLTVK